MGPHAILLQVQHVQLNLSLGDRSELQETQDTLKALPRWAEKGTLRTITLSIIGNEDMMDAAIGLQTFGGASSRFLDEHLVILEEATRRPSRRHWSLWNVVRRVYVWLLLKSPSARQEI